MDVNFMDTKTGTSNVYFLTH